MALEYAVGQKFPDLSLTDDCGNQLSIAEVAGRQPLFLAFFRGPW